VEYKYNKRAGVLNEVALPTNLPVQRQQAQAPASVASAVARSFDETTGVHSLGLLMKEEAGAAPINLRHRMARSPAPAGGRAGLDNIRHHGDRGMFFHTVQDGERVRVIEKDGRVRVVIGPSRIWRGGRRIEAMAHYIAHPGEFLIVRFRDGKQVHLVGPADLWFDPRVHGSVDKEDALQIASKEAVVVYARDEEAGTVSRRVVYGPTAFVPEPGEWLHTFSWHGSSGGEAGYQKVPNALVFQKLWSLPDQMYHDVADVRTADDAVLTIRLMLFFEMVDVETMLDTTHDPIGDFVNATTSDVVELVSKHDFEAFKRHTDRLNDLDTYRQLLARAAQCGYRINKVVYRGYGAPENLQRMHDEAIESRTRLALERATQQQAQDLEDFKLERDLLRGARQRGEQQALLEHQIEQDRRRQEAELRDASTRAEFDRAQARSEAELRGGIEGARDDSQRQHLAGLKSLGVDLTALLTQGRADRVIELRGGAAPHLHLDAPRRGEP
jgi:hypothetical protein